MIFILARELRVKKKGSIIRLYSTFNQDYIANEGADLFARTNLEQLPHGGNISCTLKQGA